MAHFGIDPRRPDEGPRIRVAGGRKGYDPYAQHPTVVRVGRTRQPVARPAGGTAPLSSIAAVSNVAAPTTPVQRVSLFFDEMIEKTKRTALFKAIEEPLASLFDVESSVAWFVIPHKNQLFAPSKAQIFPASAGPGSACFASGKVMRSTKPGEPGLSFPLRDEKDELVIVVTVTQQGKKFDASHEELAELFMAKFKVYAPLLMTDDVVAFDETGGSGDPVSVISDIMLKLTERFRSRVVELWSGDAFDGSCTLFNVRSGEFEQVGVTAGIAGYALRNHVVMNIPDVTKAIDYDERFDGTEPEPVLLASINVDELPYAIVMRGKEIGCFGHGDELMLQQLTPLLSKVMSITGQDGGGVVNGKDASALAERLQALLQVAEIVSGVLDIDQLIPTIMERACLLLNTERCSLFLCDYAMNELVSTFQGGLQKAIRLPLGGGIAGYTATTGNVVNIADAYEDPRFDNHVDLITGFRTRTILATPIYNNRGEIAGVTEMINKRSGGEFDEEDLKLMMTFNVFCGIALDNARLYQASLGLTRQLRGFVEMSTALNKTMQIDTVLEEILRNAKGIVSASRATVFINGSDGVLRPFCSIGEPLVFGITFAAEVMQGEGPRLFSREEVFYKSQGDAFQVDVRLRQMAPSALKGGTAMARTGGANRDMPREMTSTQTSQTSLSGELGNICGFPMVKNGKSMGVMELCCSGNILPEDLKLLDCFAVFAAVSLERSELQDIAKLGQMEVELKQYMTDEERTSYNIPEKLVVDDPRRWNDIFMIGFDVTAYDDIGKFKVLFEIASSFSLLWEFQITAEKWFRFCKEVSMTSKDVPYHNWRHEVDVTQFVTYQVKKIGMDKLLTKFEMLGFIVAAICHDANHDGFTNTFNEKAETPLGILFKNQSVMETHHCSIAIGIISKEECNLFWTLTGQDYRNIWSLFFQLILVTDMSKHFAFLKSLNEKLEDGPIDWSDPETRIALMQVVLKCSDISNVARPFELANKWCDVLCEEFFRQGDLEMVNGMEYTSPLNDREHLDKPKSQIGFYNFVCLPLFETCARAFPELEVNVEQIRSNLAVWTSEAHAK